MDTTRTCLQQWFTRLRRCNKSYKEILPVIPPGGKFPIPATSDSTLLALRCTPIHNLPYAAEDATSNARFIIDAIVMRTQVRGAKKIAL